MPDIFITCICPTLGRLGFLQEALDDFLKQDYKGPKSLVLLNTFPAQKLKGEFPGVRIINCDKRPASLGEARNMAIEAAEGTHIVTWDDDDVFLPNHLSNFARAFEGGFDWVWLTPQFWGMGDGVKSIVPGSCPVFAFTKKAWKTVGGYPPLTVGEDRGFIGKITQEFQGRKVTLANEDISYVYRWASGCFHTSGEGDDRTGRKTAHERVYDDLIRRVNRRLEPTGEIALKPERGVNWVLQTKNYLSSLSAQKKSEVCVVELGRYGDIINILPICQHIHSTFATPQLMVSREFASILDGVSYVKPYVVDLKNDQLTEALDLANKKFQHVICTQIWGRNWAQSKETPAYNMESWRMAGFLNKFKSVAWKPVFDRRDKERESNLFRKSAHAGKPLLLVNVTQSISSPFNGGDKLLRAITEKWDKDLEIVNLGNLRLHRIYDVLGLMDHALALVTIDTALLHLAAASAIPVVALVNPTAWQGTEPRCNCVVKMTYAEVNPTCVNLAIEKAIQSPPPVVRFSDPVAAPERRQIWHCVERHEEKTASESVRKEHAQRSWDVLYAEHGVIPIHLWHYPRTALEIGDRRALPYLKDCLQPALDCAADHDIIMWTNDDNWLHPKLPELLRYHVALYDVCVSQRCEFHQPIPEGNRKPDDFARMSHMHMGRDLFACSRAWLAHHWETIPDFILGASDFDLCLAAMVRCQFGLPFDRRNCEFNLFPAELPRGYVAHQFHPPKWNARDNVDDAPSQRWNRNLFRAWAAVHLPTLVFHPNGAI